MTANMKIEDAELANLEPLIVRGQLTKAVRALTKQFENLLEEGQLGEARLIVGLVNRATARLL